VSALQEVPSTPYAVPAVTVLPPCWAMKEARAEDEANRNKMDIRHICCMQICEYVKKTVFGMGLWVLDTYLGHEGGQSGARVGHLRVQDAIRSSRYCEQPLQDGYAAASYVYGECR
jgi:hypothetical protein